jgi:hypothetical protein
VPVLAKHSNPQTLKHSNLLMIGSSSIMGFLQSHKSWFRQLPGPGACSGETFKPSNSQTLFVYVCSGETFKPSNPFCLCLFWRNIQTLKPSNSKTFKHSTAKHSNPQTFKPLQTLTIPESVSQSPRRIFALCSVLFALCPSDPHSTTSCACSSLKRM